MQRIFFGLLGGVVLLAGSGATANQPPFELASIVLPGDTGAPAAAIPEVRPGETFEIVGDCLAVAQSTDDVRVVLSLADAAQSAEPGYNAVLATDQRLGDEGLQVRAPDMPGIASHTFRVKVFAMRGDAPVICDAGPIRIG